MHIVPRGRQQLIAAMRLVSTRKSGAMVLLQLTPDLAHTEHSDALPLPKAGRPS